MGVALKRGRMFSAPRTGPAARRSPWLTDETPCAKFFPAEDPIGKHVQLGWRTQQVDESAGTSIGVVADVKSFGLDRPRAPQIYVAARAGADRDDGVRRAHDDAESRSSLAPARAAVGRASTPNPPLTRVETLRPSIVRKSIATPRFYMLLLAVFASVGARARRGRHLRRRSSYLVTQRTREIGIRVALGAGRRSVVGLIIRQAVFLAVVGIVIGVAGAIGLARAAADDALRPDVRPIR